MNILFAETKRKFKDINLGILNNLPGKIISLAATIQYIDLIPKVKKYLESKNKKVLIKKGAHYKGHVLGCNSSAFDKSADTLLLLADGKFHAINNATQLQKEIYVFNTKALEKIKQKEIDTYNKKLLTKEKKFLTAKTVGLLVSTKYGQNQKGIKEIKKKISSANKAVYVFEADNINTQEFENFPQIEIWINTACPGIAQDDIRIVNFQNISKYLN